MLRPVRHLLCLLAICAAGPVFADDLVRMAQENLQTLGYQPGNTRGEMDAGTQVAISTFQAEKGMTVDGEVSPQLVGMLRAAVKQQGGGNVPAPTAAASHQPAVAGLQERQQACLQQKMAEREKKQKTKRAFMKIISAVSRSSQQFGDGETAQVISAASSEAYDANATYEDLKGAADDLGLTTDEMEECRNP